MDASSRPRLAPKARLRFDRKSSRYMLLYPERGLVLNATAADVVQLCTGEHTVARAELNHVRWVSHCRDLVQLPVAA